MFSTKINEPLKKRLMNSIFNQLLNVKGAVVEDARIVGSPLRPVPALEIRARPRKGMLRCPGAADAGTATIAAAGGVVGGIRTSAASGPS